MPNLIIILKTMALLLTLSTFSFFVYSAKPMSENDLGNVSAVTGDNIINLLGSPSAGLRDDNADLTFNSEDDLDLDFSTENPDASNDVFETVKASEDLTEEELKALYEDSHRTSIDNIGAVDTSVYDEAIAAAKQTVGKADSFSASRSEIIYLDKNVHHDMTKLNNNSVIVTRDLYIDLLTIDKLSTTANGTSAGSIYLSDWRSQGTSKIVIND